MEVGLARLGTELGQRASSEFIAAARDAECVEHARLRSSAQLEEQERVTVERLAEHVVRSRDVLARDLRAHRGAAAARARGCCPACRQILRCPRRLWPCGESIVWAMKP
jgi:hypothetical protein